MPDASTESVACQVFETPAEALSHGKGGIYYCWKPEAGQRRNFPEDVHAVHIQMPIDWGDPDIKDKRGMGCLWHVAEKNHCGAQWQLSGTYDKPTLHPSLNWVTMWHGWLKDGFLQSC